MDENQNCRNLWIITGVNREFSNETVLIGVVTSKKVADDIANNAKVVGYENVNITPTFEGYVGY